MKPILLAIAILTGINLNLHAETKDEKLCRDGIISSCVISAYTANNTGDFVKSAKYFLKGCDNNWGEACFALAIQYKKGNGVDENPLKAIEYFQKACSLDPDGSYCLSLGQKYREGELVKKNPLKAKEYFFKGCKLSNAVSCSYLGMIYKEEGNYTNAKKYYLKACTEAPSLGVGCLEYQALKDAEPEIVDCEILKMRFNSCVNRSYKGLKCLEGTDIVLPERCR